MPPLPRVALLPSGCLSFGGERLSLRVDALVDAEPVEQFFAAFGSQIAACTVEVVGRVGAERAMFCPAMALKRVDLPLPVAPKSR